MSGIRLHHPQLASCTLVIETELEYPVAYDCPSCARTHERKAIHLRLDPSGDVIVAPQVLAELRKLPVMPAGLEVANEVEKPPPLVIGAIDQPKSEILSFPLNADQAERFHRPGHDRYEAERRMSKLLRPTGTA